MAQALSVAHRSLRTGQTEFKQTLETLLTFQEHSVSDFTLDHTENSTDVDLSYK